MQKDEIIDEAMGLTDIFEIVKFNHSPHKILILGGYKQGKSYTLDEISKIYSAAPRSHIFRLDIDNNPLIGVNDYIPFINLLNKLENIKLLNLQDRASKTIRTVSKKADIIFTLFDKKSIHSSLFNSSEISILERLSTVVPKNGTITFLCDDVDKWDWASITLINKILMNTDEALWLHSSNFVFTASSREKVGMIFHNNLDKFGFKTISLKCISKENIIAYLDKYNIEINVEELYEFSEGNIGIISGILENTGIQYIPQEQVQSFLSDKLIKVVNDSKKVESILEMVNKSSVVGNSFQRQLLEEISDEDKRLFSEYLGYAKQGKIYDEMQSIIYFKTKNLWSVLYEYNKNNFLYHLTFANAIKKVIPSNFFVRANEFLLSDNRQESAEAYFVFVVEYMKKYHKQILIDETFLPILTEFNFLIPLKNMLSAYEDYFNEEFDQAKSLIVFESENPYVSFEKDYLATLILINGSMLHSDYKDAVLVLQNWIENNILKENEPYLWVQAAILKLEIASELNENTGNLLAEINFILNKYAGADQQFRIELYNFKARNNYTYSIDLSYKETLGAFQFFAMEKSIPGKNNYACALVNYLANSLVMGNYDEIIKISEENAELFSVHKELNSFLSAFLNNYIIAKILSSPNLMSELARDYIIYFKKLISNVADDKIAQVLYEINLGIIYFISGNVNEALILYKTLYEHYATENAVDDYYRYFIINNFNLINNYVNNVNNMDFITQLQKLNPLPNNSHFFITRNEYLLKSNVKFKDIFSMISPMGEGSVLGKAWNFWGRPLLFTDVQFWTD